MGKLDLAVGYLSGAMEMVADNGVAWRREFIKMAYDVGLLIDFVDPTDKPGNHIGESKEYQETLQKEGRWEELQNYVHEYRHYDLRSVDYSDFLVVVVDPKIAQWGTSDEVYFAERQHKPIFFVCEGELYKMPRWLIDVIEFNNDFTQSNVFKTTKNVIDHLVLIDQGKIPMSNKWILIRKELERRRIKNHIVSN